MSPTSFSPLQCYTADLCRDRGFCITKFRVQILPLSWGIHEFFCVYLVSVTCFEHRVAWCQRRSLNNYGQLPITGTLTFSGIQCPSQTTLLENSSCSMIPFPRSLYLTGPFPVYPSESSNCLLRGSQELKIDSSCPFSFNPSNIRLVSHQDNNPICKSATFIR